MKKILRATTILLAIVASVAVFPKDTFAATTKTLSPGDTYDAAEAGWNTTVLIDKAGDYTLKGQSEHVRVVVKSGGVNLYLEDGLNLNCSATSNVGSRTGAITIEEQGGTVRIISKKNASSYLEGYMAPGIRKDGTTTELIFETEDPSSPGTIEAVGGADCAGIGCIFWLLRDQGFAGNITFNSGNIKAAGKGDAAGIGGSYGSGCDGIYINGGKIEAHGSLAGAAIGGGYRSKAKNIYISGGEVYAENPERSFMHQRCTGAAIGSGGGSEGQEGDGNAARNIVISGGKVTAISHGLGAAIGGGKDAPAYNVQITGGEVEATSEVSPAIGSGVGQWGNNTSIKITGGKVNAKGGDRYPAIGGSSGTSVQANRI